jgi:hypothetical protein
VSAELYSISRPRPNPPGDWSDTKATAKRHIRRNTIPTLQWSNELDPAAHQVANPKASASNQAADRDGGHVLNLSICCCEETTLGGSRPRRPRRSLSVTENAVPCSSQQHQKVQNPLEKARPGQSQGAPPPRRERPDGTGRDWSGAEAYVPGWTRGRGGCRARACGGRRGGGTPPSRTPAGAGRGGVGGGAGGRGRGIAGDSARWTPSPRRRLLPGEALAGGVKWSWVPAGVEPAVALDDAFLRIILRRLRGRRGPGLLVAAARFLVRWRTRALPTARKRSEICPVLCTNGFGLIRWLCLKMLFRWEKVYK